MNPIIRINIIIRAIPPLIKPFESIFTVMVTLADKGLLTIRNYKQQYS